MNPFNRIGDDPNSDYFYSFDAQEDNFSIAASSFHPGGCNFGFLDGSVTFLKDTINTWPYNPANGVPTNVTYNSTTGLFSAGPPSGVSTSRYRRGRRRDHQLGPVLRAEIPGNLIHAISHRSLLKCGGQRPAPPNQRLLRCRMDRPEYDLLEIRTQVVTSSIPTLSRTRPSSTGAFGFGRDARVRHGRRDGRSATRRRPGFRPG